MVKHRRTAVTALLLATGLGILNCQEVEQPSPVLTEQQWEKVNEHIYEYAHDESTPDDSDEAKQAPKPEYEIGANYQNKIEFLGFSVGDPDQKEPLAAGEETTFRWYWRALEDIDKNWKIFVHFDSTDTSVDPAERRQNLDHEPLDGLFPTSKWPEGKIIEDVQQVRIRPDYPPGPAVPHVGFYRGQTRLSIEDDDVPQTDDNRVKAPSLEVSNSTDSQAQSGDDSAPDRTSTVPTVGAASSELTIDGELSESIWSKAPTISLSPFGSAPAKSSKVRVLRGESNLFVGARLEDEHVWSELEERDSETWREEVFELFIDPDRDSSNYLELQVNPLGTIFDAKFDDRLGTGSGSRSDQIERAKAFDLEGLESGVHVEGTVNDDSDEDEFWSLELKLPLDSIPGIKGAKAVEGPWAVNFYRFDRPDGKEGTRTLSYAWSTAPRGDFHQVDKFGTLKFSQSGGGGDDEGSGSNPSVREQLESVDQPRLPPGKGLDPARLEKLEEQLRQDESN